MERKKTYRYLLLLGGNLGEVEKMMERCVEMIGEVGDVKEVSEIYYSKAWGFEAEEIFRNQVVEIECEHAPMDMLCITQELEKRLGREKKSKDGVYESRKIDIDIEMGREREGEDWREIAMESERLTIPHALMHKRKFAMKPLAEKWGDWRHEILGKSVEEICRDCEDKSEVWTKREDI